MILVTQPAVVRSPRAGGSQRDGALPVAVEANLSLRKQDIARGGAIARLAVALLAADVAMRSVRELRLQPPRRDHRRRRHEPAIGAAHFVTETALDLDDLLGAEQGALIAGV